MDATVFVISGVLSVLAALLVVTRRNPVYSAIYLVLFFVCVSLDFFILQAPFLAIVQVLVYGGAIMVLFLFVIMLLNLSQEQSDIRRGLPVVIGVLVGAGFVSALLTLSGTSVAGLAARLAPGVPAGSPLDLLPGGQLQTAAAASNVVGAVAEPMFRTYLVPFEITSVLLLAAAVGAVVLAKRKL